jgi:hypothetical protein
VGVPADGGGSFWSGAYTRQAFDVRGGLWVEAEVSVPLTEPGPSQDQIVALFAAIDSAHWASWDHATGDHPRTRYCRLYYPAPVAERARAGGLVAPGANIAGEEPTIAVPRRVRDGQPFRALVQVFPDGRCGAAFDGRALWVSAPGYFDREARVMLVGNSQETRVLVGRVRVGTGIAPHVAWAALDTPPTHDTVRPPKLLR